jgi:RPA family protein
MWWRQMFTDGQYKVVLAYLNRARADSALILWSLNAMSLNLDRIKAAQEALHADVAKLLALQSKTKSEVETVSAQLAAAIAAGDPAGIAKAQADLDVIATSLEQDSAAIDAVEPDPAPVAG